MVALITGKLSSLRDGEKKIAGQVTGFQAFCIAVASHVGTGNLAGVAIAVSIGGPGALFWMWIIALLGAATSMIENTLAQTYKVKDGKGWILEVVLLTIWKKPLVKKHLVIFSQL